MTSLQTFDHISTGNAQAKIGSASNNSVSSSLTSIHHLQYNTVSSSDIDIIRNTAKTFLSNQSQILPNGLFGFNVFRYTSSQQLGIALGMLIGVHTHKILDIHWSELLDFLIDVKFNFYFSDNPYHSFLHALDITVVMYHLLSSLKAERFFTPMDKLVLIFAGLCHDIKHPGLNNLFQVNAKTDLSYLYGNQSVLENYTCSCCRSLLETKYNFLRNLSSQNRSYFLNTLTDIILMTDMSKHFSLRKEYVQMVAQLLDGSTSRKGSEKSDDRRSSLSSAKILLPLSEKHRIVLMKTILHLSDISNPCRPFHISKKWSDLVVQEFFFQGDQEKKCGVEISPNMDRDKSDKFEIALGFLDYIVTPFIEGLVVLLDADRNEPPSSDSVMIKKDEINIEDIKNMSDSDKGFFEFYLGGLLINRAKWMELRDSELLVGQNKVPDSTYVSSLNKKNPETFDLAVNYETIEEDPSDISLSKSGISDNQDTHLSTLHKPIGGKESFSKSISLADISNRRFSVAAGVITIPDENTFQYPPSGSPEPIHKSTFARKISYEFSPSGSLDSRNFSIASDSDMEFKLSPSTPKSAFGSFNANQVGAFGASPVSNYVSPSSNSTISSGPVPVSYHNRSRRASVEEDQSLRKYLARRRSSNQANTIQLAIANHQAVQSAAGSDFSTSKNATHDYQSALSNNSGIVSIENSNVDRTNYFEFPPTVSDSSSEFSKRNADWNGYMEKSQSSKNSLGFEQDSRELMQDFRESTSSSSTGSRAGSPLADSHFSNNQRQAFRSLKKLSAPYGFLNTVASALLDNNTPTSMEIQPESWRFRLKKLVKNRSRLTKATVMNNFDRKNQNILAMAIDVSCMSPVTGNIIHRINDNESTNLRSAPCYSVDFGTFNKTNDNDNAMEKMSSHDSLLVQKIAEVMLVSSEQDHQA